MLNRLKNAAYVLVVGVVAFWAATALVGVVQGGQMDPPGPPGPTNRTPIFQADMPYTISSSGSYYLAENLTGSSGAQGINITAHNVTLDLNGFELVGVSGSFRGIRATTNNVSVYNGTVRNWEQDGITITGSSALVKDVHATDNTSKGIYVGQSGVVTRCTARDNGTVGIEASSGSVVSNCTAQSNNTGIVVSGSLVTGCYSVGNNYDGIEASNDSHIVDNVSDSNGVLGSFDNGAGIHATGSDNRLEGNNVMDNVVGIDVDISGNVIVKNSAGGNFVTDYNINAGSAKGQIINMTAGGDITTSNGWANFRY